MTTLARARNTVAFSGELFLMVANLILIFKAIEGQSKKKDEYHRRTKLKAGLLELRMQRIECRKLKFI